MTRSELLDIAALWFYEPMRIRTVRISSAELALIIDELPRLTTSRKGD